MSLSLIFYMYVKRVIFRLIFLEQDFSIEVKVIQADFSKGQAVFDHIVKELEGMEIGILSL